MGIISMRPVTSLERSGEDFRWDWQSCLLTRQAGHILSVVPLVCVSSSMFYYHRRKKSMFMVLFSAQNWKSKYGSNSFFLAPFPCSARDRTQSLSHVNHTLCHGVDLSLVSTCTSLRPLPAPLGSIQTAEWDLGVCSNRGAITGTKSLGMGLKVWLYSMTGVLLNFR